MAAGEKYEGGDWGKQSRVLGVVEGEEENKGGERGRAGEIWGWN